jgi:hypothetical protein
MRLQKGKLVYLTYDKLNAKLPKLKEAAEREERHYYHKDYEKDTKRRKLKITQERLILVEKGFALAAISSSITLINYKIVYNHGNGRYSSSFKVAGKPGWEKVKLDKLIEDVMPLYVMTDEER